jgi:transcriptional regulator with XRE-family HTH domain
MPKHTTPLPDDPLRLDFTKMKHRRLLQDVTQARLAAAIGIHHTAISYWETGKRRPGILDLVKVGRVLGTPFSDLFDVIDQSGNPVEFRRRGR